MRKSTDSVYLVMYPSKDPANETFESFRYNRIFLNWHTALNYIHNVFIMSNQKVYRFYSETRLRTLDERERSRSVMNVEFSEPNPRVIKYAIIEMQLHGEFATSYYENTRDLIYNLDTHIFHILEFNPKTKRPVTQYPNIHSVHTSGYFMTNTIQEITDSQKLDWHSPFGHETNHLYTPFTDKDGNMKYLVMSGCRLV